MFNRNLLHQTLPPIFVGTSLGSTAKTATINCEGGNFLVLDVDYTYSSGTALVFAFTGDSVQDSNQYGLVETNYGSGVLRDAVYTYQLAGASVRKKFFFNISGIGKVGNIVLSIQAVGGGAGDILNSVQPYVCIA